MNLKKAVSWLLLKFDWLTHKIPFKEHMLTLNPFILTVLCTSILNKKLSQSYRKVNEQDWQQYTMQTIIQLTPRRSKHGKSELYLAFVLFDILRTVSPPFPITAPTMSAGIKILKILKTPWFKPATNTKWTGICCWTSQKIISSQTMMWVKEMSECCQWYCCNAMEFWGGARRYAPYLLPDRTDIASDSRKRWRRHSESIMNLTDTQLLLTLRAY